MIINATEVKNNFGKMLKLLDYEDIFVKRNGRVVAKMIRHKEEPTSEEVVNESNVQYDLKDKKISYEEFLKLTTYSDKRYELLDGEIFMLSSPTVTHQSIVGKLHGELYNQKIGECVPFVAPYDIKLLIDDKINILQPDLGIICDLENNINENDQYIGVPSLVIEVLSPSSISRDKVRKLNTYMLAGVKEYWIVDPKKEKTSVYRFVDYEIDDYEEYDKEEGIKSFLFSNIHIYW